MDEIPAHSPSTDLDDSTSATAGGVGATAAPVDGTPASASDERGARTTSHALTKVLLEAQRWASRQDSLGTAVVSPELSLNELWLLQHLGEHGRARLSELATWQRVDKSTVSAQVKSLIARGLVERRTDPADRRASLIAVTTQGMTLAAAAIDRALPIVAAHQSRLTAQETTELIRLLRKFLREDPTRAI